MTDERDAFYRVLFSRRDVRSQFLPDAIPSAVLARLLQAAHHAPSVGLSQPWNFILVRTSATREAIHAEFRHANSEARAMFEGERGAAYRRLKLEGIREAPVNLCITCDRRRGGPVVLGRTHQRDTDLYSTVCAVQNLWLAARAEGLGLGWVSILHPEALQRVLALPEGVVPVAYVCLGYVDFFHERPELEKAGWEKRLPLASLVYNERWGERDGDDSVFEAIADLSAPYTDNGDPGSGS